MAKWLLWILCAYLAYGVVMTASYVLGSGWGLGEEERCSPWTLVVKWTFYVVGLAVMIVLGPITKWFLWPYVLDPLIGWVMDNGHLRLLRQMRSRIEKIRADWRTTLKKLNLPAG